jgi:hypothetical protein
MKVSHNEAKIEIALLNSHAQQISRADIFARLTNEGLPPEVIYRLEDLFEATNVIGEKIVYTGKIIIMEIIRFFEANPHLAIGAALGAAVGAMVGLVPWIGPLLAPTAAAIGIVIGGVAGARIDRGQKPEEGVIGVAQDLIILAKKFFELFAAIFLALKADFVAEA